MHKRTQIRHYVRDMLADAVDVGGRVYASRPDPVFLEETPCVVVFFDGEEAAVSGGDRYSPAEYERTLDLKVDIVTVSEDEDADDDLDRLAEQVERAIAADWFLGKRFDDFNPHAPDGLSLGASLSSTKPYTISTDAGVRLAGQVLSYVVPYITETTRDEKLPEFARYGFELTRDTDVDPVMMAGEVEING